MAIEFKTVRVNFVSEVGEVGNFSQNTPNFSRRVVRAHAAINGFDLHFTGGDREFKRMMLNVNNNPTVIGAAGRAVQISGSYLLRDSSGNIDDRYDGWVDVLVIAQTEGG